MSRPAMAASYRCQTRVFSFNERSRNPPAYTWTTAASSIRSRRYFRSAAAGVDVAIGAGAFAPQAAVIVMIISARTLFMKRSWALTLGPLHSALLLRLSQVERDAFQVACNPHRPVKNRVNPLPELFERSGLAVYEIRHCR